MVILLCYTSAFSDVICADFYAKILDWNFRLVDEKSQILVVVFVSKLNFSFSFCFIDENCWIFVVVFVTKINLFSSTDIFVFVIVDEKKHCILLCVHWPAYLCSPVRSDFFIRAAWMEWFGVSAGGGIKTELLVAVTPKFAWYFAGQSSNMFRMWKNVENWSAFGKVVVRIIASHFDLFLDTFASKCFGLKYMFWLSNVFNSLHDGTVQTFQKILKQHTLSTECKQSA